MKTCENCKQEFELKEGKLNHNVFVCDQCYARMRFVFGGKNFNDMFYFNVDWSKKI